MTADAIRIAPLQATLERPRLTLAGTDDDVLVSVVIPCLDEAETIARCVTRARAVLDEYAISGEVIVVDNGSRDGSAVLAADAGARLISERARGYGSAYRAGFAAARGRYIVMGDADLTYDFGEIPRFVEQLTDGADLVIGDRMHHIHPGAMPWLHRYVGNPLLTGLLNAFFHTGVDDAHCGMRALRRDAVPRLDLRTSGMEFASEMVMRAAKQELDIRQLTIEYHPRGGESKLSSFRDGWRHLRLLLTHSPTHLFLVPGGAMLALGALVAAAVLARIDVLGRSWELHTMVVGCMLMIVGLQVVALGLCARAYGVYFMGERDPWFEAMRARVRLEHGLLVGGAVILAGAVLGAGVLGVWARGGFGTLAEQGVILLAATLVVVGVQICFSSFLLSILGLRG